MTYTQRETEAYLANHNHIRNTYELSDTSRCYKASKTYTLIKTGEIQNTIKSFKNNTPGESKINKIILENTPEKAITILQSLLNHSLSMGYFPNKLKTGIIKLQPKPHTDNTNPLNYRPISLLEVPGKILEKIKTDTFLK